MQNCRYYIKHKQGYDSFLSKISISCNPCSWISLSRYTPNISRYPLSWTSLESIYNSIQNEFMYEYGDNPKSLVDYNVLFEFQNMKIVKAYAGSYNPEDMYEIENSWDINPENMLRRSAWTFNAFRKFSPSITEGYEENTKLNNRRLGTNQEYRNEYYLEIPWGIDNRNRILNDIANLGIIYFNISSNVLVISSLEDVNLIRLSISGIKECQFVYSQDLLNLENNMSCCCPIPLYN